MRLAHGRDGLLWVCERCNDRLYEEDFALENIETELPKGLARYQASVEMRTCEACGHVDPLPGGTGAVEG